METIAKEIGRNIRKYRLLHRMTREQLAEALNLDTAYLGQCERGERQLGLNKTLEIVRYFHITANDLIPINCPASQENRDHYMAEIQALLAGCSDQQLFAIQHCIQSLLPFLKP